MIPILQNLLCDQYPTLYQHQHKSGEKAVFECNDGWLTLIDTLSALIVKRSPTTVAQQVKEDHGSLLFCTSGYAREDYEYFFGVTNMAYWLSQIICEKCGSKGTMFNTFGLTARCELHDRGRPHLMEYDETVDLPFQIKVRGTMWRLMILEFYHLIQLHIKCNDMPDVDIKCVHKVNGKLCIEFTGGNEMTQGMLALLLAYAARIDEETGDILTQ